MRFIPLLESLLVIGLRSTTPSTLESAYLPVIDLVYASFTHHIQKVAHTHDSPLHSFTVFQNTQTKVALILTNFLKYAKHSKSSNVINPIRCRPTYISFTQVEGIARGQRIYKQQGNYHTISSSSIP